MIYKIRITLDVTDDVLREVIIDDKATLEDLHNVIVNAFGFDGMEMASFYLSNEEWEQGEEIPLFDMSDAGNASSMERFRLHDVINEDATQMIYVYDYFNLWTFFVELKDIIEDNQLIEAPAVLVSTGKVPGEAPEKEFTAETYDEGIEDYDSLENFDDFDFDDFEDSLN
ncbi:MAG: hypothetical protein KDC69_07760 [Flavobacteriaceae bacterium]|nr:hypothetical protein [Flavobacteriaceae bacterium]